jgi:hypothetical protein
MRRAAHALGVQQVVCNVIKQELVMNVKKVGI